MQFHDRFSFRITEFVSLVISEGENIPELAGRLGHFFRPMFKITSNLWNAKTNK